ncbi:MAG: DegT/DnrJ/EryC1/StrS family aminotransferase [Nitrospira sp.]|nr:DegT/DnrJ/EryC1/StrS family aminotransferase [Nitrospira sp.]
MITEKMVESVPFIDLSQQHKYLKAELLSAVGKVLDHGQFILGPEVKSFERCFADYCGVRYAVGVDNGTSALMLTLKALGIGQGDEVITVPNSFLATVSCIANVGAKPVFTDVRGDLNIDPDLLENAITARTRAVIPVHLTGRPADMGKITALANKYGLFIIEDCAQAAGARYYGQKVGGFGIAGCFSLHPLKVLGAIGDGGIITTNNTELYEKLIILRNHGLRNRDECETWSVNSRLDTIQAAMLLVKMSYIDKWIEVRRAIAAYYREKLRDYVAVPEEMPHEFSVYQTFIVQAERRDELQKYLSAQHIETKIHYPIPLHIQEAAEELGYAIGSFPVTENLTRTILSLPIYPELNQIQIETVISAIKDFYGKYN